MQLYTLNEIATAAVSEKPSICVHMLYIVQCMCQFTDIFICTKLIVYYTIYEIIIVQCILVVLLVQ